EEAVGIDEPPFFIGGHLTSCFHPAQDWFVLFRYAVFEINTLARFNIMAVASSHLLDQFSYFQSLNNHLPSPFIAHYCAFSQLRLLRSRQRPSFHRLLSDWRNRAFDRLNDLHPVNSVAQFGQVLSGIAICLGLFHLSEFPLVVMPGISALR